MKKGVTAMGEQPKSFVQRLGFPETIAMSIALMAPTTGVALNTPFLAQSAGYNVPLAFFITTLAILAVGIAFIRLSKEYAHAGSVYGLTRTVLGDRAGLVSGWALLLTYVGFIAALLAGFGQFAQLFLQSVAGVHIRWPIYAFVAGGVIWWMAHNDIRLSAKLMLSFEVVSVVVSFVASILILLHSGVSAVTASRPFIIGPNGITGLSSALVFGVLTFIGFEGAVILGEEAKQPSKSVPRSVLWSLLLAGVFFTFVSYAQTIGFGEQPAQVQQFATSAAPMNQLAVRYVGSWMAMALDGGATISTFACALASLNGASHIIFALARDGFLPPHLGRLDARTQSPRSAVLVATVGGLGLLAVSIPYLASAANVYGALGALATFGVLIAYAMVNVTSLARYANSDYRAKRYHYFAAPVIGLALLVYTFYANVFPIPPAPIKYFPYVLIIYLAIATIGSLIFRQRSQRVYPVMQSERGDGV